MRRILVFAFVVAMVTIAFGVKRIRDTTSPRTPTAEEKEAKRKALIRRARDAREQAKRRSGKPEGRDNQLTLEQLQAAAAAGDEGGYVAELSLGEKKPKKEEIKMASRAECKAALSAMQSVMVKPGSPAAKRAPKNSDKRLAAMCNRGKITRDAASCLTKAKTSKDVVACQMPGKLSKIKGIDIDLNDKSQVKALEKQMAEFKERADVLGIKWPDAPSLADVRRRSDKIVKKEASNGVVAPDPDAEEPPRPTKMGDETD